MDGWVDAIPVVNLQHEQALKTKHAEALRAQGEAAEAEREAMAQHCDKLLEEEREEARAKERELAGVRRALERAEEQAQGATEMVRVLRVVRGGRGGWRKD